MDIYPTLLTTFNLSKKVGLTLAPKEISRFLFSDDSKEIITMPGATMSISVGPAMPEIVYYTGEGVNFFTFGVAINIKTH